MNSFNRTYTFLILEYIFFSFLKNARLIFKQKTDTNKASGIQKLNKEVSKSNELKKAAIQIDNQITKTEAKDKCRTRARIPKTLTIVIEITNPVGSTPDHLLCLWEIKIATAPPGMVNRSMPMHTWIHRRSSNQICQGYCHNKDHVTRQETIRSGFIGFFRLSFIFAWFFFPELRNSEDDVC